MLRERTEASRQSSVRMHRGCVVVGLYHTSRLRQRFGNHAVVHTEARGGCEGRDSMYYE